MRCQHCGADLGYVGVTVKRAENVIYMRGRQGGDLEQIGTAGEPTIERVQCRGCFRDVDVKAVEALKIA